MSALEVAETSRRPGAPTALAEIGPRLLLALIRERPHTRGELMKRTGFVRSTLTKHLDALTDTGLVRSREYLPSTGGRPPEVLSFNPAAGLVLAAHLGRTSARLAVTDLGGTVLEEREEPCQLEAGPEATVAWLARRSTALLAGSDLSTQRISAIAVGLPALVDPAGGRIVDAPGLPQWEGFHLADALIRECRVAAVTDSDVNMVVVGEQCLRWPAERDLMFVKIDSSIAAGLLVGGRLIRGSRGSAGDIAHVQLDAHKDVACSCGGHGCLAAVASGAALARRLDQVGVPTACEAQFSAHLAAEVPEALVIARDAGHAIGAVLSMVINTVNPATVVLGGSVAAIGPHVLAAVREEIYRRARAVATQDLVVVFSRTWMAAALAGASRMAIERLLSPEPRDEDQATFALAAASPRQ
jgi:glucokinase